MSNINPFQTCTVSPYSEYNSNVVNKLTRMLSNESNCINSGYPVEVVQGSATTVIVSPGSVFKDDVFISIDNYFTVDFEDVDFYISGPAFNEAGYYYVLLEYKYVKSFPAPQAAIKLVKATQHALFTNLHILLKVVHVIFNGISFEIDEVLDGDPVDVANVRKYSETNIGLENSIPTFDPDKDPGRFIYVRNQAMIYFGLDTEWLQLGIFEYPCDTSGCSLNYLSYIGPGDIAYPAIATSKDTLATCFVTKIGSGLLGRVRFNGKVTAQLETGIDSTSGEMLYLSATEAGTVTNVRPNIPFKDQLIGRCISSTPTTATIILSGIGIVGEDGIIEYFDTLPTWSSGDEGRAVYANDTDTFWFGTHLGWIKFALTTDSIIHNALIGLQGGDATSNEYYHLTSSQHTNIGDGSHNSLEGLQGGVSGLPGQRYHLSFSQYVGVGSTLPATLMSMKSYILSLLSYNIDTRSLWDKDLNGELLQNTPIGDVISQNVQNNNGGSIESNKSKMGLFGLFASNFWTAKTNMLDSRGRAASISLTDDLGIVMGGNNGATTFDSVERYSNITDIWASRTVMSEGRSELAGSTLTTNLGLSIAGLNLLLSPNVRGTVERYSDSGNSWTARTSLSPTRGYFSAISYGSNYTIVAGGNNNYDLNNVDLFTESANTWTSKNSLLSARHSLTCMSLTNESGICCGGSIASVRLSVNEKFSLSLNTWSSKIAFPTITSFQTSMSFNSDNALLAGGNNGVGNYSAVATMFSESKNSWMTRSSLSYIIYAASGLSFTQNSGMIAGGGIGGGIDNTPKATKFTDNELLALSSGFLNLSTYSSTPTPLHHSSNVTVVETNRLTNINSPLASVLVSMLYNNKKSTDKPTFDVTLDDGATWLMDQDVDTYADVSLLVPSGSDYQMRLRLKLAKDASANTWTAKTGMTGSRFDFNSISFNSNNALVTMGGFNTSLDVDPSTSELYSNSLNTWTSKTSCIIARGVGGFSNSDNYGIVVPSFIRSTSTYIQNVYKYNLSADAFSSMNNKPSSALTYGFITLDYNSGITCGGDNGSLINSTYKQLISSDVWLTKTTLVLSKQYFPGANLTNNTGIINGGFNGSILDSTEKFNDSSNIWISKTSSIQPLNKHSSISLTSDIALFSNRRNTSGFINNCSSYSDSGNIWLIRNNNSLQFSWAEGINQTSNLGLVVGGNNSFDEIYSSCNNVSQYCHGETSMIGFSALYI